MPQDDHRLHFATWAFALAMLWICGFSHLGALGLIGADEPRYAFVARNMAATGDWVTPRLYGQPWFEKPILYYWAAAAFFRVLPRAPEWASRLPSALAAIFATLTMAWTARRLCGARAGYFVLLVLTSSAAFIGFSRSASTDMLFTGALTVALASAATICIPPLKHLGAVTYGDAIAPSDIEATRFTEKSELIVLIVFGAALGIATLAKGPAALILAAGSIGCWAALSGQWRRAFGLAHPIAIFVYCIVALPWYVICAIRNPDFFRVFILQHNFQRYLTPVFQHRQPLWYFIPIVLIGLFPWTPLLGWLAMDAWRACRENAWRNSAELFMACWAGFPFMFFSLSQSKLPGYILPAVPPLAVLVGLTLARSAAAPGRCTRIFMTISGFLLAGAVSFLAWGNRIPHEVQRMAHSDIVILVAASAIVGMLIFLVGLAGDPLPAIMVTVLAIALILEFVNVRLLPKLDPILTARSVAGQVQAFGIPEASISAMPLQREWQYGLNFYLGNPLREWEIPLTDDRWVPPFLFLDYSEFDAQRRLYPDLVVLSDRSPHAVLVRLTPLGPFAPYALLRPPHTSR
jgi:4-amino-4-deoxy-L-arabinose transferase-like glycosyltransferase